MTWTPMMRIDVGDGPVVALAVHDGHELRPEIAELCALSEEARRREEDPGTGAWTRIAPTRVVARRSRFEVDLNRPREQAFYRGPEDAWGLEPWRVAPSEDVTARSLAVHDAFYATLGDLLDRVAERNERFVVLDLHSYNHRRGGPFTAPDDPERNPDVNVGTGSMDRAAWAPLVDRFMRDLAAYPFPGGTLDVRENVKFRGREVPAFVHARYPGRACAIAIEVKKIFMDEWSGVIDAERHLAVERALASTLDGLLDELVGLRGRAA